jgi:hypothetical protein
MDDTDTCPNDPDNDGDGDLICAGNGYKSPKVGDNDNCPGIKNGPNEASIPNVGNQLDTDGDGKGDACENSSGGGKPCKNCSTITDTDGDGLSDTSETTCNSTDCKNKCDCDGDGVSDGSIIPPQNSQYCSVVPTKTSDNCPCVQNYDQLDTNNDGQGDACDDDDDGDGILDSGDGNTTIGDHPCMGGNTNNCDDNCRLNSNADQADIDNDGIGNVCDKDADNDGYCKAGFTGCIHDPEVDCDDLNGSINPGKTEVSNNGKDDDCNPATADTPYSIVFKIQGVSTNEEWLPTLTWDPGTEKWVPGEVTIEARLRNNSTGVFENFPGIVTFSLSGISQYPGIAINDKETCPCSNDVSFDINDPSNILPIQINATGSLTASVNLYVFDFAAKVTLHASTSNGTITDEIEIPIDGDHDDLPTYWEDHCSLEDPSCALNSTNKFTYSANKTDAEMDIDVSENNTYNFDGLSNFNEYRGVIFDLMSLDGSTITGTHKRLHPKKKDLFVRGDGYKNSTECRLPIGSSLPYCRVNNNDVLDFVIGPLPGETGFKNAFENAGIVVHDVTGMPSFYAYDGINEETRYIEPPNIDIVVVYNDTTHTDTLEGGANGYINQIAVRYWTWDTKGASYYGDATMYHYWVNPQNGYVNHGAYTYHLNLMHYFHNRPYWDSTVTDGQYYVANTAYIGKLDPESTVEDKKIEDGSLQKTNKTTTNEDTSPTDGYLTGDHVKLGKHPTNPSGTDPLYPKWDSRDYSGNTVLVPTKDSIYYRVGYDFSPFDADNNGLVEPPDTPDPLNTPLDRQADPLKVQRQTIMHEMGHAVGIRSPEHPCEIVNAMCVPVQNWDVAGVFSPDALRQIIIHNATE